MHEGRPITRHNLARLFASVLKREADGSYWLETPAERGAIMVEDLPFIAIELRTEAANTPQQLLSFRTNMDDWVTAGADHALTVEFDADGTPAPAVLIRNGLSARINRPVYYELTAMAVPAPDDKNMLGVWSNNIFFPIGRSA